VAANGHLVVEVVELLKYPLGKAVLSAVMVEVSLGDVRKENI